LRSSWTHSREMSTPTTSSPLSSGSSRSGGCWQGGLFSATRRVLFLLSLLPRSALTNSCSDSSRCMRCSHPLVLSPTITSLSPSPSPQRPISRVPSSTSQPSPPNRDTSSPFPPSPSLRLPRYPQPPPLTRSLSTLSPPGTSPFSGMRPSSV
jgi:hypothetical protein